MELTGHILGTNLSVGCVSVPFSFYLLSPDYCQRKDKSTAKGISRREIPDNMGDMSTIDSR